MTERNNKQSMGLGTWMAFTLFRNLTQSKSIAYSPSWTANSPSACQESTCNLWTLKIHYRVHKIHHFFVSWARWLQSLPSHPVSWRSVLILSSSRHLGLPNRLLPSGFSTRPCMTFYHVQYTPHDSPPHFFNIINLMSGEEYKLWSYSLRSRVRLPITALLLDTTVLRGTPLVYTLSL